MPGDAGYPKDPITAQGMTDALLHAEMLAEAAVVGLSGRLPLEAALASYHRRRGALAKRRMTGSRRPMHARRFSSWTRCGTNSSPPSRRASWRYLSSESTSARTGLDVRLRMDGLGGLAREMQAGNMGQAA